MFRFGVFFLLKIPISEIEQSILDVHNENLNRNGVYIARIGSETSVMKFLVQKSAGSSKILENKLFHTKWTDN